MTNWVAEFNRLRPHIEAALKYSRGTHTSDDVLRSCLRGEMQFWPGRESAAVTEVITYPQLKACHIFLAGGKMEELAEMLPYGEAWAREQGCSRMTLAGRKGWERSFLADAGYAPAWYVMHKELKNE